MEIRIDTGINFTPKKFFPSFMVTWVFLLAGSVAGIAMILIAGLFEQSTFFYFFAQKLGLFLVFTALLAAYAGVYISVKTLDGTPAGKRATIKAALRKSGYVILISLITAVIFGAVIIIETGFSMVSQIPYFGPGLMALLTAPLFLLNIFCALGAVCVFAVMPPVIAEADGIKDVFSEIKILVSREWLNIIFYLLISISLLTLGIILIVVLVKYTAGITKAVQWKISAVYPPTINTLVSQSYFTDLIYRMAPTPDSISEVQKYGPDLIHYLKIIKYIIGVSYIAALSFIASFPLAVYFYFSSIYFRKIWAGGSGESDNQ